MKIGIRIPCYRRWCRADEVKAIAVTVDELVEPSLEGLCLRRVAACQPLDALPDLSDDQHAEEQPVCWNSGEPAGHAWVGSLFSDLRHHIGVEQEAHG